jgi:hypothetical protein
MNILGMILPVVIASTTPKPDPEKTPVEDGTRIKIAKKVVRYFEGDGNDEVEDLPKFQVNNKKPN